jgi:hypothetical protein
MSDNTLVVAPLTFRSSCYWGRETKWCTTSKDNPETFEKYMMDGTLVYYLDKHRMNDKNHPMGKLGIHMEGEGKFFSGRIFNRFDDELDVHFLYIFPKVISTSINEYHLTGGIDPEPIYKSFDKYMKDVVSIWDDEWIQADKRSDIKNSYMFNSTKYPSYNLYLQIVIDKSIILFHCTLRNNLTNNYVLNDLVLFDDVDIKQLPKEINWDSLINADVKKEWDNHKNRLIQHILFNEIKKNSSKLLWDFKPVGISSDIFGINNNLGQLPFELTGKYSDLGNYKIKCEINFNFNEFVLYCGESNKLIWKNDRKDFNLLYQDEKSIEKFVKEFKKWVITSFENTVDKKKIDLYEESTKNLKNIGKYGEIDIDKLTQKEHNVMMNMLPTTEYRSYNDFLFKVAYPEPKNQPTKDNINNWLSATFNDFITAEDEYSIIFYNTVDWYLEYIKKEETLYFSYSKIYKVLKDNFEYNTKQIFELVKYIIIKKYNLKITDIKIV